MTYKILSLDGGGVWALIQVRALISLYGDAATGRQVLQDFDLAAANSGGAIVLGGLLEDLPLSKVLAYFEDETLRRSIFQPTKRILDGAIHDLLGFGPQYDAEAKLAALQALMPNVGQKPLAQAAAGVRRKGSDRDLHVLITSFDYDRNIAAFFRSADTGVEWGQGAATPEEVTLADAVHASSNAPVNYFDEPAAFAGCRYWDGAISGCNNPVLAGVTEAVTLNIAPEAVRALSLGTGTVRLAGPPVDTPPSRFVMARSRQDVRSDLAKVSGVITDDPPDVASFLAHVMTGGSKGLAPKASRIVRLNPMVSPVRDEGGDWAAPDGWSEDEFDQLANLHLDAIGPDEVACIARYAETWIAGDAPNQPLRMRPDTLEAELGPDRFGEAVAAWKAIAETAGGSAASKAA